MPPTRLTVPLPVLVPAEPLTRFSFAPFGDVIENPHPEVLPAASLPPAVSASFSAVPANQGTAIKYQHVSAPLDLYAQAPSGAARPIVSLFSCAARALEPARPAAAAPPISTLLPYTTYAGPERGGRSASPSRAPPLHHPDLRPLAASDAVHAAAYLVIVAPTLAVAAAAGPETDALPAPATGGKGPGLPDLKRLKAFVAYPGQAVTYGAGTWHAPMVALGPQGTAIDFVVTQFASGVAVEDCQEVELDAASEGAGVVVQVPERMPPASKL
ncbi:ureidoglycolate hydrolase [Colletotrichum graminicola M1.001]|uniref:Ureidoglycolate hydrolase n=1 Tax=Colletotrichum graminicola (strain M1.001 / M2 / FGSC 10212) TaxID=645133 RepID=E3QC03_COLGM|nr:ureidoglycolate hydrolase [Colletotrichum graminicola M1.001]EFQ28238.1 ureidoglycolate hydrolase [Colletotrichum graminicola M1.001]